MKLSKIGRVFGVLVQMTALGRNLPFVVLSTSRTFPLELMSESP